MGGLYHGYRQVRNRKVNEALVQGVETARAILTTTPQGQAADAQFVKWLMEHQKEAGVFTTVSGLVDQLSDNPAAKLTAQEIAERVKQAQQQRTASQSGAWRPEAVPAALGVMTQDKQLREVSLEAVVEKRRLDQALNAKEFAVLAGISYSAARSWFRMPGFPVFRGVVFWQDFVQWRNAQNG